MNKIISCILAAVMFLASTVITGYAYEEEMRGSFYECTFENSIDISGEYSIVSGNGGSCMNVWYNPDDNKQPTVVTETEGNFVFEFKCKSSYNSTPVVSLQFDNGEFTEFLYWPSNIRIRSSHGYGNDALCYPVREDIGYHTLGTAYIDYRNIKSRWNSLKFIFNTETSEISFYWDNVLITKYIDSNSLSQAAPRFAGKSLTGIKFSLAEENYEMDIDDIKIYKYEGNNTQKSTDKLYNENIRKLTYLDALYGNMKKYDEKSYPNKYEFIASALLLKNINISGSGAELPYSDVGENHAGRNVIETAYEMGIIDGKSGEKFRPDGKITLEEAVTVICNLLGYKDLGNGNYINLAYSKKLLDDINVISINQYLTQKDAAALLVNALTAPMVKINVTGAEKITLMPDEDYTILKDCYHLDEKLVKIRLADTDLRQITYETVEDGSIDSCTLAKGITQLNIEGTTQYLWLDDETVEYMYPYKNSEVFYGVISEYNNRQTEPVAVKKLSKISFFDYKDTLTINKSKLEVYLNRTKAAADDIIDIVDRYVRVEIQDNAVVKLEIFGNAADDYRVNILGLIENMVGNGIRIQKDKDDVSMFSTEDKRIVAVVNGKETSFSGIKKGMVIDYAEIDGVIYIFGSDACFEGTLSGVSSDALIIGDQRIYISDKEFYISKNNGFSYSSNEQVSDYISAEVTIITDMSGRARYMYTEGINREVYGIVFGRVDENDDGEKVMSVGVIEDGKLEKEQLVYNSSDKNIFYPRVSFETAVANAKKTDGSGLYKFIIKGNKIREINEVTWDYSFSISDNVAYNSTYNIILGQDSETKTRQYYKLNSDKILITCDDELNFDPTVITKSQLGGVVFNSTKVMTINDGPNAEFVLITSPINNTAVSKSYSGIVGEISQIYDEEDEAVKYAYTIYDTSGTSYVTSEKELKYNNNIVEKGDIIYFRKGALLDSKTIVIRKLLKLNESDETSSSETTFQYKYYGVASAYRDANIKTVLSGEEKWTPIAQNCVVVKTNKTFSFFEKTDITEAVSEDIYMVVIDGTAAFVVCMER
ncbi:MAG: S-layer homology domain-containing protein [Clostridia bacterium]|nr:S-layer homology domain-containing protein [Clostridia bacterium]